VSLVDIKLGQLVTKNVTKTIQMMAVKAEQLLISDGDASQVRPTPERWICCTNLIAIWDVLSYLCRVFLKIASRPWLNPSNTSRLWCAIRSNHYWRHWRTLSKQSCWQCTMKISLILIRLTMELHPHPVRCIWKNYKILCRDQRPITFHYTIRRISYAKSKRISSLKDQIQWNF
jgi:hypothetical protein